MNANGRIAVTARNTVRFSAQSDILFNQTRTIISGSGRCFTIPESAFPLENDTHVKAKATKYRGLSRISYPSFPTSPARVSANPALVLGAAAA
jgi:hypothetical protein